MNMFFGIQKYHQELFFFIKNILMLAHARNPSILEMGMGGSGVQGQLQSQHRVQSPKTREAVTERS